MEIDAASLADGTALEAELCIVGAGPAGLVVARRLADAGRRVVVLESGGRGREEEPQRLNEADATGDFYPGFRTTRHRQIGGASQIWNTPIGADVGAKYAPLDPVDFRPDRLDDRPGWPITFAELEPWYREAQRLIGLGPFGYQGTDWAPSPEPRLPARGPLTTRVYQLGTAGWAADRLPDSLAGDPLVTLCAHATVIRLVTDPAGHRVVEARAAGPSGAVLRVRADRFVVAAGALETARILLASAGPGSTIGLGNGSDWVGRCFMEHPRDSSLSLVPSFRFEDATFLDARPGWWQGEDPPAQPTLVVGRLGLTEAAILRNRLPNASATLFPVLRPGGRGWRRLAPWLDRSPAPAGFGWSRHRDPDARYGSWRLLLNLEQRPCPENRLILSGTTDRFGIPRARIHWEWRAEDRAGLARLREVVRTGLEEAGLGRVVIGPDARPDPAAHHHAGTARMAASPTEGVVDRDGRVFGVDNLFVAGGAVFPTAGFANPTLTIVALAARLAARLTA